MKQGYLTIGIDATLPIVGYPSFIVIIRLSQNIFFNFDAAHSLNWYFTQIYYECNCNLVKMSSFRKASTPLDRGVGTFSRVTRERSHYCKLHTTSTHTTST